MDQQDPIKQLEEKLIVRLQADEAEVAKLSKQYKELQVGREWDDNSSDQVLFQLDVATACMNATKAKLDSLRASPTFPFAALLTEAMQHLDRVLNGCTTHAEQQAADKAARDFLDLHYNS